jgi:sugar phosphate isomerase/epimerase
VVGLDPDAGNLIRGLQRAEMILKNGCLPVLACNGFIRPAHLHCVGKDAKHDDVLKWADIVFRRLKQANRKFIEIAEKEDRSVPGVAGDDFRPFFRVLKAAGYKGAINIEAKSKDDQLPLAVATIFKQAAES